MSAADVAVETVREYAVQAPNGEYITAPEPDTARRFNGRSLTTANSLGAWTTPHKSNAVTAVVQFNNHAAFIGITAKYTVVVRDVQVLRPAFAPSTTERPLATEQPLTDDELDDF